MLRAAAFFNLAAAPADAEGGAWMLVFPAGATPARDGRGPFNAGNAQSLQAIVARTKARLGATEMMVDYDHQAEFGARPGVGGRAAAAGWVREIEARGDGIWARIEWTPAAKAALVAKEYRYLSPLFTHDKAGNVLEILNVALVNMPAFDLAAAAAQQETDMNFAQKLAKALGLAADTTEDAILASLQQAQVAAAALKPVALAAGLAETADATAIVAGIAALRQTQPGGDAVKALRDELATTATALNELRAGITTERATAFVDAAIKAGRVGVKPLHDHYIARHAREAAAVEKEINTFPVLNGSGAILPPAGAGVEAGLTATDRELIAMMSLDAKKFAERRAAEVATL